MSIRLYVFWHYCDGVYAVGIYVDMNGEVYDDVYAGFYVDVYIDTYIDMYSAEKMTSTVT